MFEERKLHCRCHTISYFDVVNPAVPSRDVSLGVEQVCRGILLMKQGLMETGSDCVRVGRQTGSPVGLEVGVGKAHLVVQAK